MALGHEGKLIAPQHVQPYVARNKNDARDAVAICEAAGRPNMKFVAVKSVDQQALLALHRARDGLVTAHTALGSQLRGLLAEFGVIHDYRRLWWQFRRGTQWQEAWHWIVPTWSRCWPQPRRMMPRSIAKLLNWLSALPTARSLSTLTT